MNAITKATAKVKTINHEKIAVPSKNQLGVEIHNYVDIQLLAAEPFSAALASLSEFQEEIKANPIRPLTKFRHINSALPMIAPERILKTVVSTMILKHQKVSVSELLTALSYLSTAKNPKTRFHLANTILERIVEPLQMTLNQPTGFKQPLTYSSDWTIEEHIKELILGIATDEGSPIPLIPYNGISNIGGLPFNSQPLMIRPNVGITIAQPVEAINHLMTTVYAVNHRMAKYVKDVHQKYSKGLTVPIPTTYKPFHLAWRQDFRGRLNSVGYSHNPQGSATDKVMLQFAEGEMLTPQGVANLELAIAKIHQGDKETVETLSQWIEKSRHHFHYPYSPDFLMQMGEGASVANDKLYLIQHLQAYQDHLDGKPVYLYSPQDATNSGNQIFSVLTADKQGAETCNVSPTYLNGIQQRADLYAQVAGIVNRQLSFTFTRSDFKSPVMVMGYGQGAKSRTESFKELLSSKGVTAFIPEQLNSSFEKAYTETNPKTMELMLLMQEAFIKSGKKTLEWTLPDGFKVKFDVTKEHSTKVPHRGHHITLKWKEHVFNEFSRGISPQIIHSIDSYIVRQMILLAKEQGFRLVPIHDSFSCHPNYLHLLRPMYLSILTKILQSDLLNKIWVEAFGSLCPISRGDLTRADIMECEYALY